jgi:hypothetical protein
MHYQQYILCEWVYVAEAWGWQSCDLLEPIIWKLKMEPQTLGRPKSLSKAVYGLFAYYLIDFTFDIISSMNEV